ncbi:MAG: VacJ family lipoprotein [Sphingomonas sp.]|nr:VacJ family lipoprotein [Sphingomonas sp.]
MRHAAAGGVALIWLLAGVAPAQAQALPLGAVLAAAAIQTPPAEAPTAAPVAAPIDGGAAALEITAAPPPAIAYVIAQPGEQAEPAPIAAPDVALAAPSGHAKGDRYEKFNRAMYKLNLTLDRIFFRPLAIIYKTIIPKPIRLALRNLLVNVSEPLVFLNDLLQLRPGKAIRTLGRFTINTTLGIGGLIDVAKGEGLPHRNNGFGNTLARYGVGPGPYLFLPLIGPSTLRDTLGDQAQGLIYPLAIGEPFDRIDYQIGRALVLGLQQRIDTDVQFKMITRTAADPYATIRSLYLQDRKVEVDELRGRKQRSPLDDPLTDPGDPGEAAPAADPGTTRAPDANVTPPEQLPAQPR